MGPFSQIRSWTVDHLRGATAFAIDVVYPKRCAGCGRRGSWLCEACDAGIDHFVPPWCAICGVPVHLQCRCASLPDGVEQMRSAGPYEGWFRGAVVQCKYHGEWGRAEHLAEMLAKVADDLRPFDALVPVPLHPSRFRQRGFNQAQLLAQHAAKVLAVLIDDVLMRTRRTDPQVHLGATQRFINVQGAIQVKPGSLVSGRSLVLVDDVVTTGSTLAACATALVEAGACCVKAATVTREM